MTIIMSITDIKPEKNKSLVQAVIDEIIYQIKKGELKPGDKIDSQRELSRKLKVGRSCIREAMQALSLSKIVDIKHGKGAYVSPISLESILNPVNLRVSLDKDELLDLLKIRMILESEAIKEATKNVGNCDLQKLKKHLENSRKYLKEKNYELYYLEDYEFHRTIAKCSRNNVLASIFNFIFDLFIEGIKTTSKVPGSPKRGIRWHKEIYRKIRLMDVSGSEMAMRNHIKQIMEDLKKV
ncbi:MAG: FadR/GntR family transcriptional regulator [Actinomycetota bacterium]